MIKKIIRNNSIKVLLFVTATLFFISCENSLNEVRKINLKEINPTGVAKDFNLKYTDSGKIKAVLISPKMLDFSTVEFPFNEFPQGLNLTFYDENGNKNFVTAKYAVSYSATSLFELKNQVIISTFDGKRLETEQLYYDQKNEWFFTEKPFRFTDQGSVINGVGIDFSKNFDFLDTQQIQGNYSL